MNLLSLTLSEYGSEHAAEFITIDSFVLLQRSTIYNFSSMSLLTPEIINNAVLDIEASGNLTYTYAYVGNNLTKSLVGNIIIEDNSSNTYTADAILFCTTINNERYVVASCHGNTTILRKNNYHAIKIYLSFSLADFTGGITFSKIQAGVQGGAGYDGAIHIEDERTSADDEYSVYNKQQVDYILSDVKSEVIANSYKDSIEIINDISDNPNMLFGLTHQESYHEGMVIAVRVSSDKTDICKKPTYIQLYNYNSPAISLGTLSIYYNDYQNELTGVDLRGKTIILRCFTDTDDTYRFNLEQDFVTSATYLSADNRYIRHDAYGNGWLVKGDLNPSTTSNNTEYDIGSTSHLWKTLYATTLGDDSKSYCIKDAYFNKNVIRCDGSAGNSDYGLTLLHNGSPDGMYIKLFNYYDNGTSTLSFNFYNPAVDTSTYAGTYSIVTERNDTTDDNGATTTSMITYCKCDYSSKWQLGTSSRKLSDIYATTFHGNLDGTVTQADQAGRARSLYGSTTSNSYKIILTAAATSENAINVTADTRFASSVIPIGSLYASYIAINDLTPIGSPTTAFKLTCTQDGDYYTYEFLPNVSGNTSYTYSLGSSSSRWSNAYFKLASFTGGHGSVTIEVDNSATETTIRPSMSNYCYLGNDNYKFYRLFVNQIYSKPIAETLKGKCLIDSSSDAAQGTSTSGFSGNVTNSSSAIGIGAICLCRFLTTASQTIYPGKTYSGTDLYPASPQQRSSTIMTSSSASSTLNYLYLSYVSNQLPGTWTLLSAAPSSTSTYYTIGLFVRTA